MADTLSTDVHQTRVEMAALRKSMEDLVSAVTQLAKESARYEERHKRLEEMARRIGKQVDSHDQLLRSLEKVVNPEKVADNEVAIRDLNQRVAALEATRDQAAGGWKTISIIGAVVVTVGTLGVALYSALT